jgi:hypothetical protein
MPKQSLEPVFLAFPLMLVAFLLLSLAADNLSNLETYCFDRNRGQRDTMA